MEVWWCEVSKLDSIKAWLRRQLDKALVIAQSAVTIIAMASTVCTVALTQIVPHLPDPLAGQVTLWAIRVIGALTAATLVIRRVTPVVKDLRGILPVNGDPVPAPGNDLPPEE